MEHVKKMYLVEPRLLDQLQQPNSISKHTARGSNETTLDSLKGTVNNIARDSHLSDVDKVQLHDQALHRFLTYKEKFEEPMNITMTPTGEANVDPHQKADKNEADAVNRTISGRLQEEIIKTVPKPYKNKTKLLLERIGNNPNIRWNDSGELVFKNKVVKGSNVVDLINDVARKRKTFVPQGWQTFATALKSANVPRELVGHPDRWLYMQEGEKPKVAAARCSAPATAVRRAAPLSVKRIRGRAGPRWDTY